MNFTFKINYTSTGKSRRGALRVDARDFCAAYGIANKLLSQKHQKTGYDYSVKSIISLGASPEKSGFVSDLDGHVVDDLD